MAHDTASIIRAQADEVDVSDLPLLLSPAEAARQLSLSRDRVYGMIREGEIASVQLGRRIAIRREELIRYIEEHSREISPREEK